jgi:SAM-dependent methyltransferase
MRVTSPSFTKSDVRTVPPGTGSAPSTEPPDYIERNRELWERWSSGCIAPGLTAWRDQELRWGIWSTPEPELRLLEDVEPGGDVIELGCGTASISAALARRSFRMVAVDFSTRQLATVKRFQHEFELEFPLIRSSVEQIPFDHSSFDLAISEYGASLWCNPRRWLPEAHRLLRSGGRLIFFTNGALLMACTPPEGGPAGEELVRDYFSEYRVEFPGDSGVEFHVTHGHWIRLLRASGFVVERLIEVRPPPGATARFDFVSLEWARRWPSEEVWVARKIG